MTGMLKNRLSCAEETVLHLISRESFLSTLQQLLGESSRDGQISVHNDIVYRMASDSYELFVIDLASFGKGAYERGGFLNHLNSHLSELLRHRPKKKEDPEYLPNNRAQAYKQLFPDAVGETPKQADIYKLNGRWRACTEQAVALRNKVHAHRYQGNQDYSGVNFYSLEEARQCLEELAGILNNIRLLRDSSTLAYDSMNGADEEETAEDIRDLILHGNINSFVRKLGITIYRKLRDDFYASKKPE